MVPNTVFFFTVLLAVSGLGIAFMGLREFSKPKAISYRKQAVLFGIEGVVCALISFLCFSFWGNNWGIIFAATTLLSFLMAVIALYRKTTQIL